MTEQKYSDDIIEKVAQFIWREFENDHDFDPSYPYAGDARRYAIAALDALGLTIEYAPGHMRPDGAFVGAGRIAPGYVQQYISEGGRVVSCFSTPWEEVTGDD